MALAQLQLLVKVQQEKEDKLQAQYRAALQNYQSMQQKYQGLADYRIEYVQQTQSRGQEGMASRHFNQYLNFIGKLDAALTAQQQYVQQAKANADQRLAQLLAMQKKRKALEILIERDLAEVQRKADKQEQKMLDEIATQQFFRRVS
ncbi:MAG: flagellar export protein FliJ [Gammaproteobacteria bacterium]|nr:flagellar export protein FliJ [Gammaproteobacteria bacterium]MBU2058412.1 flagellar export protein FliJ [Gammaproteobacteria bacterium]MBU2176535.1 flagellar export protein FliJ [Gammaproteobacteria bacterium]MBU2248523.1 flagellar export protein FliJ [Gammaproteobacteria bacterium]MBU2345614.1 flagellar export protein FliJ [Gammaproteobacteria bacterium]